MKFVPASGAASRMFKNLFEFLGADYNTPKTDFEKKFFDHIHSFAFYNDLNAACMDLSLIHILVPTMAIALAATVVNRNAMPATSRMATMLCNTCLLYTS